MYEGGDVAKAGILEFDVKPVEEGIYSVEYRNTYPNPLVVIVGKTLSAVWPNKELILRFKFLK